MKGHFDLYKPEVLNKNIPLSNIYNMDEEGIQLSRGRKTRKKKYFIQRDEWPKYHIRSEDFGHLTEVLRLGNS